MPYKDPFNFDLIAVMCGFVLAVWGALANYLSKLREEKAKFSWFEFIAEVVVSGFASIMVYLLCMNFDVDTTFTIFLCGMAGHFGGKTMLFLSPIYKDVLQQLVKR